jgi:hypothetical protein
MNSKNLDELSQQLVGSLTLVLADSTGAADMSVNIPVDAASLFPLTQILKAGIYKIAGVIVSLSERHSLPESSSN